MKTMLSNLAAIAQNTQSDNIRMIDIDQLHESQANFFEIERIEEFAYTILGQGGVKDNLVVRPLDSGGYEIVSGHRRRAAVMYLLEHGESISRLLPCLIQSYSDEDSMMLDLILLNVSARQLSDQELWQSYENLNAILKRKKEAGEKFGRVREKIAEILGVSPSQVGKMQNVDRNAIEPVKEAVATGAISISTANVIAQLDEEQQEELASGDLSEVKPKEIKKVTPKVDTSSNFNSTVTAIETDAEGVDHAQLDKKELVLSFSDKKSSLQQLQAMYVAQGVPDHVAKGVAKDAFRKAEMQNPEKTIQIQEIREQSMRVAYGMQSADISTTDKQAAADKLAAEFGVPSEVAETIVEKAEEIKEEAYQETQTDTVQLKDAEDPDAAASEMEATVAEHTEQHDDSMLSENGHELHPEGNALADATAAPRFDKVEAPELPSAPDLPPQSMGARR